MPVYTYYCHRCLRRTNYVGEVDGAEVICAHCGRPMWRKGDMASILAAYDESL